MRGKRLPVGGPTAHLACHFRVVLMKLWLYRSGSSAPRRSPCAQAGVTQKSLARAFDVGRINDVRHLQARCPRVWVRALFDPYRCAQREVVFQALSKHCSKAKGND
jgi:hypothetical protein